MKLAMSWPQVCLKKKKMLNNLVDMKFYPKNLQNKFFPCEKMFYIDENYYDKIV